MKRRWIFSILLALLLTVSMLSGCTAKLPEGFDEEAVTARAVEMIELLNAGDFAGVEAATRTDLREAMSAEVLEDALGEIIAGLGAFEGISATALTGTRDSATNEEYAVAVVIAIYENGKAQYTISFNQPLELVGLYMK